MDDGGGICFSRKIVQSRKTTPDVGYTQKTSMDGIKDFGLCIDLMHRTGVGRRGGTRRSGRRPRNRLHFEDVEKEEWQRRMWYNGVVVASVKRGRGSDWIERQDNGV